MENSNVIKFERSAYNYTKFKQEFDINPEEEQENAITRLKESIGRTLSPSKSCMTRQLTRRLPVINLVRTYRLKFLLRDVLSGLTVGVIQIAPSNRCALYLKRLFFI